MIEKLKKVDSSDYSYIDENGVSHSKKSDYLQDILGFCGCGDPFNSMVYVKNCLDKLGKFTEEDYKSESMVFFLYWADNKGYTEHGSSIWGSWLTDTGKELINDIQWCIENEGELDEE